MDEHDKHDAGAAVFSHFTASARRVMQRAFREAKRWQHDFVGTEHLLYGLLCDADGPAVTLLRALGARPDLMLEKVELSLQRHDASATMEQFPLSPASRRVFGCAAEEAGQFRHQMIGPEHLLLGLLRETDCEAAQILSAHGVGWTAARNAVAQIPPDAYREAQIQTHELPRLAPGDNPSADDLEHWIAPPITQEALTADLLNGAILPDPLITIQEMDAQLRRTHLLLGFLMGYTFGHCMFAWWGGLIVGLLGVLIAATHQSWVGVLFGMACGYLMGASGRPEVVGPLDPILLAGVGGFIGSFLGNAWRFSRTNAVQQPPRSEDERPEEER
jgi:hypothetical protein